MQVWPHQCSAEGKDPFPQPAGCALPNAYQETVCLLCGKSTLEANMECSLHQWIPASPRMRGTKMRWLQQGEGRREMRAFSLGQALGTGCRNTSCMQNVSILLDASSHSCPVLRFAGCPCSAEAGELPGMTDLFFFPRRMKGGTSVSSELLTSDNSFFLCFSCQGST